MAAIESAADAIVVAGLDGLIRYVNPAFERDSRQGRNALLGTDIRSLTAANASGCSGQPAWDAIRRGETWSGELVTRLSDGTVTYAEATIAPVRGASGTVVGSVTVKRDVTRQRALETRLDEYRRERTALIATLGAMRSGSSAESTAVAIGLAIRDLAAFGPVGLFSFEPSGRVVALAVLDRDGASTSLPGPLSPERSASLRERAARGPWIEERDAMTDHPAKSAGRRGGEVVAYVPIRADGDTLGLIAVSPLDGDPLHLAERLPALVECGVMAGALLGPQLRSNSIRSVSEARIQAIIADRAFTPVFQPIVAIEDRAVVGYEALTRFLDGSLPDVLFGEAARSGLGLELEAATLEAILAALPDLSNSAWLNLNVSAELILAEEPLRSLLGRCGWQVVLELTEHIAVSDYSALRAAIERLGPRVRLAVDDAGAGFSSLRHILELGPDYIKLDRGIVHHIHRDPARQALVAGLVHFATRTGATLIAEGIEAEAEARQLRALGVTLGQGYRLGRPGPASAMSGPVAHVTPDVGRCPSRHDDPVACAARDDVGRAVNIGQALASALREGGISTIAELRTVGAVAAWERLRRDRPELATGTTLLELEGATRGVRISRLELAERARLRRFAASGMRAP